MINMSMNQTKNNKRVKNIIQQYFKGYKNKKENLSHKQLDKIKEAIEKELNRETNNSERGSSNKLELGIDEEALLQIEMYTQSTDQIQRYEKENWSQPASFVVRQSKDRTILKI